MVWHYNYNPDFVPYFDEEKGMWAVSIQYLNVWFFPTEEEATKAIPLLKEYRLEVLKDIEQQNKEYYKKIEIVEEELKKYLVDYKKHDEPIEKLCSELSASDQRKMVKLLDKGCTDEQIMSMLGVSKRAIAIKRYHRYKKA